MRFRLDAQHYADDKLLEPGMEVGDGEGTVHPWRFSKDIKTDRQDIKAGQAMPPSLQMTPLDNEAREMYRKAFKSDQPERDPMKPIPLQGTGSTAKVPPVITTKPSQLPTPKPAIGTSSKG